MPKPELVKRPAKFPKNSTFDPPERYCVKDPPGIPGRCAEFFAYWIRLAGTAQSPSERSDLIEARWYMHVPKIRLSLIDPKRKNNVYQIMTGPLWFENPEDYIEEVPRKMGAASWHVVLNEVGVHGALAECYFEAGSYEEFPPKVDLRTLVRDDAANEEYLRFLRITGVQLPWEQPEEDFDDMGGEGVKVAFDAMKDITKQALESKERETEAKIKLLEAQAEAASEVDEEDAADFEEDRAIRSAAVSEAMGMMSHATKEVVSMVTRNSGSQFDPVALMKVAHDFATTRGPDPSIAQLVDVIKDGNQKMVQMQEHSLEFMGRVIGMNRKPDGSWEQGPQQAQQRGISGAIEDLVAEQIKSNLGEILGLRRRSNPEPAPAPEPPKRTFWDSVAENPAPFMTILTTGVAVVASILSGRQVSPDQLMPPPQGRPPQPQQAPPPQQQQPRFASNDIRAWERFPRQLEGAFKQHFHGKAQNLSGVTFADFVIANGIPNGPEHPDGRRVYESIKANLGLEKFDQLLRTHGPIRVEIEAKPDEYMMFLHEFFNADALKKQQKENAA